MSELQSAHQLKTSFNTSDNLFVFSSDVVWGAGCNIRGQISDNSDVERDVPIASPQALRLPTGVVVVGVSVGDLHMVICARDGTVFGRGSDALGQLGHIRSDGRNCRSFPKLIVPMQQLAFFHGKPVRQCFCLPRSTIFALADDRVFVCGENHQLKMMPGPVELHVPHAVPVFGSGLALLRGVAFSNTLFWITSAGRVLLSNRAGNVVPSPHLPDVYRTVVCVAHLVLAVPERGDAVFYVGRTFEQHVGAQQTRTQALRVEGMDPIMGCVGERA